MSVSNPTPEIEFFTPQEPHSALSMGEQAADEDWRWRWVEEFFRSRELADHTQRAYKRELRRFLTWTDQPWQALTHHDLDRYKAHLHQWRSPTSKTGCLSAATIRQSLSALQSFFTWLTVKDYIAKNPTLTLEKPKPDPVQSREFQEAELAALHDALAHRGSHAVRDTALLWVLEHGLRASEVVALNVGDYDGDRLQIRQAKAGSVGCVPLVQQARQALDGYLAWRGQQRVPVAPEAPLFVSHSRNSWGKRLHYEGIRYIIKTELGAIAAIDDCTPHRLRHTFATRLVLSGMDIALAKRLTRHKSDASFERYSNRALDIAAERQFYAAMGELPEGNP